MKKLVYKISIAAPREKVWQTMLDPGTYQEWTAAGWPGSFYEGKWKQGEKIRFISKDGSGTLALISEFKPYDYIESAHIAILNPGGSEDINSELAKGWIGTTEDYRFTEENGITEFTVEIKINPGWEKMFDEGFPKAIKKLKEICEQIN